MKHPRVFLHIIIFVASVGCLNQDSVEVPEEIRDLENLEVYPAELKPELDINIEKEREFGDTDTVHLGAILKDFAVDDNGRVYIADLRENKIHVFNPDGSYVQAIGRAGRGPGEFQMIWAIQVSNDHLHVLDFNQSKISTFSLQTYEHIRDIDVSLENQPSEKPAWVDQSRRYQAFLKPTDFFILPDDKYLIFFSDPGVTTADHLDKRTYEASIFNIKTGEYENHNLFSFRWTGQVLVHDNLIMFKVPYKRSSQFDFNHNTLVYGWTNDPLFKFYSMDGEYQRALYYPLKPVSLEEADALAVYQATRQDTKNAIRNDDLPDSWPVFNALKFDDEKRLWISTTSEDLDVFEWWVLKDSGELLTTFTLPRDYSIEVIKDDYFYTHEIDRETGLQRIVKYRVEMN